MPTFLRLPLAGFVLLCAAALAGAWLATPGGAPQADKQAGAADWLALVDRPEADGFPPLPGGWQLDLPDDHGAHPEARMETWYVAANLRDERGQDLALQLSLSRLGLIPPEARPDGSPWALEALWRGHVALSDLAGGTSAERFRRGFPGIAGYDPALHELRLDDWSVAFGKAGQLSLTASAGAAQVALRLSAARPPLSPEAEGGPFRGYAVTRMDVAGEIDVAGTHRTVTGTAWLDHLWGELPLPGGPVATDRLQLHLEDGSDLSVTRSRRRDGGGTPTVNAVVVGADGGARQLDGVSMVPTRTWSGDNVSYPLDWRLEGPDLSLTVTPLSDDQARPFAEPVWSGAVTAAGERNGRAVSATGTLNLTGYSER